MFEHETMQQKVANRKPINDIYEKFEKDLNRLKNGDINVDTFKRYCRKMVEEAGEYRDNQSKKEYIDLSNSVIMKIGIKVNELEKLEG